ncbi:DUF1801 domain-containing protein [Massilia endophytica]|uniref:DUF1801 domain-containing protein n=1 Tax=Massilia endophytica TaxID=2899220 RepID=UPI001E31DAC6|nr:DUF1801 domain-containing protein [Massilia endophytica]UGQ48314.1 DUF1801 domain-containing protein [Massilia endophytica]
MSEAIEAFLATLPEERQAAMRAVRETILANLDSQYRETMLPTMIGYGVPHSVFPAGYHCNPKQPLPFAALASQKNYMSLYMMGLYVGCTDEAPTEDLAWFRQAWAASGKKLDMGKSCLRFKKLDDLALDVLGEAIRRMPAQRYIALYQQSLVR